VGLPEEVRDLLARNQELVSENGELASRVTELASQNTELAARVQVLEAQLEKLGREMGRNSGNSGKPPSSDSVTQRPSRDKNASHGKNAAGRCVRRQRSSCRKR